MKTRNLRHTLAVGALSFCGSATALDSATVVSSTLSTNCMEYRVVGICFWLFCTNFGCSVRTSVKVRHFIPELVVSTYANTGNNPWRDVASMSPPTAMSAGGGNDHSSSHSSTRYSSERFKNSDAIGHPGGYVFTQFASSSGYVCKTGSTAYMPYFLSTLDPLAWRHGLPESMYPEALTPGMREVGTWGHLFPRSGWVNQTNDYKAAAVVSQRVGDFVTQRGQPHVYWPLTPTQSDGYWPPVAGDVEEGDISTHKWQALWPVLENTCAVFPSEASSKHAEDGGYAWAFWRPYSCCEREGQTFLGSIDFAQEGSSQ